jgi:hypothetical protein
MSVGASGSARMVVSNIAGVIFIGFVAYSVQCPVRYALQSRPGTLALIIPLVGALVGSITLSKLTSFAPGILVALILMILLASLPVGQLPQGCCDDCVATGADLVAVASKLIGKEEAAVKLPDLRIIDRIYADDARVTDIATGNAVAVRDHYKNQVDRLEFLALEHATPSLILNQANTPNEFKVTTLSFGKFQNRGSNHVTHFQGADLWTIGRDGACCCWKIKAFEYNANR